MITDFWGRAEVILAGTALIGMYVAGTVLMFKWPQGDDDDESIDNAW
jgi:hypothetical protein